MGGTSGLCIPGTWAADPVPATPDGLTASTQPAHDSTFLDNSGHLHLVRYYDFPSTNTVPPAKRHWVHLVRPPGAQWTSASIVFQGSTNSSGGSGIFVNTAYRTYVVTMNSVGAGGLAAEISPGAVDDDWFHPPPLRASPLLLSAGFRGDGGIFALKNNTGGHLSATDGTLAGATLGAAYATVPFTGTEPQADIDDAGTSHAAYLDFTTHAPMYASKTTGGAWTTPEATPGGVLVVTPAGVPHLLRVGTGGLIEAHRTSTGWVDQVIDPAGTAGEHGTDKLGRVHIAYATATNLKYARIAANGTITSEIVSATPVAGQIRVDRTGTVRIYASSTVHTRCAAPADAFAASAAPARITEFPNAPLPGIEPDRWVYDAARGRAILYQGRTIKTYGRLPLTQEWDPATKTWATGGPMLYASAPGQEVTIHAAGFDWASGKVIAVGTDQGNPVTLRWDGPPTGWTTIANQNPASGSNVFLGYDGPSSTFTMIASGALLRWTGTAWQSINSTGTTVPGTLVYDDERRRILAYATSATAAIRLWEWNSTAGTWDERTPPSGNLPPSGAGKMVTAGTGKMAFCGAPTIAGDVAMWIWDASTGAWTSSRSEVRPYLDYALSATTRAAPPMPAYAGPGRILLAGPANWDRSYEPSFGGGSAQPAYLNLVTPTWEWTLP